MTDKQKLADLPQEEREQLVKAAQEAGLNTTIIANWYVDTLKSKIEAAKTKTTGSTENTENTEKAENTEDEPDLSKEKEELNKDPEKAPVKNKKNASKKTDTTEKVKICHICRAKVVNGKCTGCGFEISKR